MSVADALQLMLAFGTFIVALVALIVELIKSQQNLITLNYATVLNGSTWEVLFTRGFLFMCSL